MAQLRPHGGHPGDNLSHRVFVLFASVFFIICVATSATCGSTRQRGDHTAYANRRKGGITPHTLWKGYCDCGRFFRETVTDSSRPAKPLQGGREREKRLRWVKGGKEGALSTDAITSPTAMIQRGVDT